MAIKMFDLAGAEPDRRFSPYCWRIKLALMHKGLEFETIPWRFTDKSVIAPYNSERSCTGRQRPRSCGFLDDRELSR
jgi:Glutathione S-transferase, N-terminal domain